MIESKNSVKIVFRGLEEEAAQEFLCGMISKNILSLRIERSFNQLCKYRCSEGHSLQGGDHFCKP